MERPIVAILTLNGQAAIGPRYVAASCEAAGAETHLIHLKLFRSREVSREETRRLDEAYPHGFVIRVHPKGDELLPHPNEVSETEMGLLVEYLKRIGAQVVGISLTSVELRKAIQVTETLHERLPAVPVAWGGVHAILNPETSIVHADMVCTGEGDEVLVEYLAAPNRRDLPGMWFRDGDKVYRNPMRPLISDLDTLPFPSYGGNEICIDSDKLDDSTCDISHSMERHYQIVTARGCPFACSYCLHSKIHGLYPGQPYLRRRSVANVMRELEMRAGQGFFNGYIPFFDEVFVKDRKWIEEFAPAYGRHIDIPFAAYAHEAFSTVEMFRSLVDVGMKGVSFGFQSGSERVCREIYNRRNNFDRLVHISEAIHGLFELPVYEGLTNTPFETEEDCRATLEFLLRLPPPFYLQMFRLEIFPGTEVEKKPKLENPTSLDAFRFWNMLYQMTQSEHLSRQTIRELANDPYLRANPDVIEGLTEALFPVDPCTELTYRVQAETRALQERRSAQRAQQAAPRPSLRRRIGRFGRRILGA